MKKLFLTIALCAFSLSFYFSPFAVTGCAQAPTERVAAVQTLKGLGAARDAAMGTAARLFNESKISREQWMTIVKLHDDRFAPAYRLAVAAVKADLSSLASPDLQNLFQELFTAISALAAPTT